MDIDKLEAGPALDGLIALEVMGFGIAKAGTIESLGFAKARGEEPSSFPPKCVIMGIQEDDNVLKDGSPIPPYSTDIAAAWEVVEKLHLSLVPTNTGWIVSQHHLFEGPSGEGKTAPVAICRAALKTLQ